MLEPLQADSAAKSATAFIVGSVSVDFGPTRDTADKSAKVCESTLGTMLIDFGRVCTESDRWGPFM